MRSIAMGVAAVLAIMTVAPASAFEFDSTGGATPGTSAQFSDPYNLYEGTGIKAGEDSEAPNGAKMLNGLQMSVSGGNRSSSSVSGGAMGWTNPQPGRLTH